MSNKRIVIGSKIIKKIKNIKGLNIKIISVVDPQVAVGEGAMGGHGSADAYLKKPFTSDELADIVEKTVF